MALALANERSQEHLDMLGVDEVIKIPVYVKQVLACVKKLLDQGPPFGLYAA